MVCEREYFTAIERSMQALFRNILSGGRGTPADFDLNRFNLAQTRKYDGLTSMPVCMRTIFRRR